jgi:hypothetical protein
MNCPERIASDDFARGVWDSIIDTLPEGSTMPDKILLAEFCRMVSAAELCWQKGQTDTYLQYVKQIAGVARHLGLSQRERLYIDKMKMHIKILAKQAEDKKDDLAEFQTSGEYSDNDF